MTTAFYLNNREANKDISVYFSGKKIKHEKPAVSLAVILDLALTYNAHLYKVVEKLKTKARLSKKLASISHKKLQYASFEVLL